MCPSVDQVSQSVGAGAKKTWISRALDAIPLMALAVGTRNIFSNIIAQPGMQKMVGDTLTSGQIQFEGQVWNLPTRISPIDLLVTVFSPSLLDVDPIQKLQAVTFLIDAGSIWFIYIMESHRLANKSKYTFNLPILYGIAFQMFGIGMVAPIWFFFHYVQSHAKGDAAREGRPIDVAAAKTVLPVLVLAFIAPTLAMYYLPDKDLRLAINSVWQAFPVITIVFHFVLQKTIGRAMTSTAEARNSKADMQYIGVAVWTLAVLSVLVFNIIRFTVDVPFTSLFFPPLELLKSTFVSAEGTLDLVSGLRLFLQVDELACFSAAFIWLALLIKDLKDEEMTSISWLYIAAYTVGGLSLVGGPGAVVVLGWWWRENILAEKHVEGSVKQKT